MELIDKVRAARRVYIIGNGGSYANAAHIATDLFMCGIKAHTIDPAILTRNGNDLGYENVFADWIKVYGEEGDLLIALSGSGTSPNILKACEVAERIGMSVWMEFGAAQGLGMQEAEERQVQLGHNVMWALRDGR